MALKPPRTTETEGGMDETQGRVQPIRPVWQGGLIWLAGLIVFLAVVAFAARAFLIPALSGTSSPSAAEAHLGQLQTQEALTPARTPEPVVAATSVPTVARAVAATAFPTLARATSTPVSIPAVAAVTIAAPTAAPTVSPELAAEVSQAYLRYFQVTADAFLQLDPSSLAEVAVDGELASLRQDIADFKSQGRALRTSVQHNFSVVSAFAGEAEVADQYRDSSVFVDPETHEPLPDQVIPASPDVAPLVRIVYRLQNVDGTWKVAGGTRYE